MQANHDLPTAPSNEKPTLTNLTQIFDLSGFVSYTKTITNLTQIFDLMLA